MSTCGSSLRHIFESTIQENAPSSSLIESLSSSFKHIRPVKPPLDHSFTEIFGELHFRENPDPIFSSSNISQGYNGDDNKTNGYQGSTYHKRSSSLNSESLQLCTEGLGSESLDYVEDLKITFPGTWQSHNRNDDMNSSNNDDSRSDNYCFMSKSSCKMGEKVSYREHSGDQYRKRRTNEETFPPPISCIGKTGKPGVWFQSFREDGRFVLKEVRIPTYERLHASREDGRLRLRFIQPSDQDDEVVDEDDEGEEERKEETEVRDDIERGHS